MARRGCGRSDGGERGSRVRVAAVADCHCVRIPGQMCPGSSRVSDRSSPCTAPSAAGWQTTRRAAAVQHQHREISCSSESLRKRRMRAPWVRLLESREPVRCEDCPRQDCNVSLLHREPRPTTTSWSSSTRRSCRSLLSMPRQCCARISAQSLLGAEFGQDCSEEIAGGSV